MKNTIKVAINTCYGGFSVSRKCIDRMIELGSDGAQKTLDEAIKYCNTKRNSYHFFEYIKRWDPILIQAIEELGDAANGASAELVIEEISLDDLIEISNHDGKERVRYGKY